jgi:glycerol-3-phosphate cytidylyltransferase
MSNTTSTGWLSYLQYPNPFGSLGTALGPPPPTPPRTVLTIGTFDLYHPGHATLFRRAAQFGSLYVGINSDEYVERFKGVRPVLTFAEREALVASNRHVMVTIKCEGNPDELIRDHKPNLLIVGSDWAARDYYRQIGVTQKQLDSWGVQLAYLPYTREISSSEIRARICPPVR